MFSSKYGLQVICGVVLLLFAIPQLSIEYSYDVQSIFAFLWLGVATLFVAANWRRMMKVELFTRLQKERERRSLWLESQKQLLRRRRGRVTQTM